MLSQCEENLIQETWALISSDLKGNGEKVFLRFFTDFPIYQKSFRSFANVPFENLPGNKRFIAHAYTVMNAIDGMVNSLDDPEMLDEMLLTTGANHGRRKISGEAFDQFKLSFMGFMENTLKERWTTDTENAWDTMASVIMNKIKDGLDEED